MTVGTGVRSVVLAVAGVALLFGAVACSGNDDESDSTTTAEVEREGGSEPEETTTTLSDEEYTEEVEAFSSALAAAVATGDVCEVIEVQNQAAPPVAANAEQMEQVVELAAEVLRAYAVGVDDPELVAGLEKMADDLRAEAERSGYPLDFLETAPESVTSEEAQELFARVTEIVQPKCLPETVQEEGDESIEEPAGPQG